MVEFKNMKTTKTKEILKSFESSGILFVNKPEEKFIKGQWYTHTEPGQEKFLIRIDDIEKQICSGWDCKGKPFKNEWVHLGNRLKPIPNDVDHIYALDRLINSQNI